MRLPTGVSPSMPALSRDLRLGSDFVTPSQAGRPVWRLLQPPIRNGCRLSRGSSFGCSPFARHY